MGRGAEGFDSVEGICGLKSKLMLADNAIGNFGMRRLTRQGSVSKS